MKKILLFATAILFAVSSSFAQNGVKWETGTFQEALNKAKSNKKGPNIVFMDCYTTWCGPCKHMANVVFPTKEAGDYFNKNFVNFKQDMEKGEGLELAKKYAIKAYPTFLILDSDGNEIGRVVGGGQLDEFIKNVENAKDPSKSPVAMLKKYEQTKDTKDAFAYLEAVEQNYMIDKIVDFMSKYYDSLGREKYSEKTWNYAKQSISLAEPFMFNKILSEKSNYDAIYGKGAVDFVLSNAIKNELFSFLLGRSQISAETVDRACEVMVLTSSCNRIEEFIMNAAKAFAKKDTKSLISMFDARVLGYSYSQGEVNSLQRIFLSMNDIPEVEKARFVKERRENLEQLIKNTDKEWEQYKDITIPERPKGGTMAAIRM